MGSGLRALKVATIVMGVLIVVGTAVVIGTIARRAAAPAPASNMALMLDEPAGTRIAGIAAAGDRLAVQLQGGGGDRIVLVDPRSGTVVGRISLAH